MNILLFVAYTPRHLMEPILLLIEGLEKPDRYVSSSCSSEDKTTSPYQITHSPGF